MILLSTRDSRLLFKRLISTSDGICAENKQFPDREDQLGGLTLHRVWMKGRVAELIICLAGQTTIVFGVCRVVAFVTSFQVWKRKLGLN